MLTHKNVLACIVCVNMQLGEYWELKMEFWQNLDKFARIF
jgi:hypothetical protein